MDKSDKNPPRHGPCSSKEQKTNATPLRSIEKENPRSREIHLENLMKANKKIKKNTYCLPSAEEIERRTELQNEFNRIHALSEDTCDWLVNKGFKVTNNDRRNLSALMKTCFDPAPFSLIGKEHKELSPKLLRREKTVIKSETKNLVERSNESKKTGGVNNAPKSCGGAPGKDIGIQAESSEIQQDHTCEENELKPEEKDHNKLNEKDHVPEGGDNEHK